MFSVMAYNLLYTVSLRLMSKFGCVSRLCNNNAEEKPMVNHLIRRHRLVKHWGEQK